jgi:hypothetical protein
MRGRGQVRKGSTAAVEATRLFVRSTPDSRRGGSQRTLRFRANSDEIHHRTEVTRWGGSARYIGGHDTGAYGSAGIFVAGKATHAAAEPSLPSATAFTSALASVRRAPARRIRSQRAS